MSVDNDLVNHPAHYQSRNGMECIDWIKTMLTPEEFRGYLKGAALKYQWRYEDKAQAVKVLEECAEVYGAWDNWQKSEDDELRTIMNESADLLQALCNLLEALGVHDMRFAMERCEQRNRDRGRFDADV